MIFGNINNLSEFPFLEEQVKSALNMQRHTTLHLMKREVMKSMVTDCLSIS